MRYFPKLVVVFLPLIALPACERAKPDQKADVVSASKKTEKNQAAQDEKTDEKPDEASDPDPRTEVRTADPEARARAARWKAHDAHTHLNSFSYPVVEALFATNRIYRAVNLSGGARPKGWRRQLDRARKIGWGRIAQFMNVDWSDVDDEDFGRQVAGRLQKAVAMGYAGLKISKSLGLKVKTNNGELLPVDTPKLDPLWEKAGQLGVPVTIHTADPKAFFEKPGPKNERWEELKHAPDWSFHGKEYPSRMSLLKARNRVLARHPDTTFILAHLGNNPEDLDDVADVLEEHPNAVLDTSARVAEFGRHPAERVRNFFLKFQDRILFGTDLGVRAYPDRQDKTSLRYSLFLGSISKEPPTLEDVEPFYEKHWRYFETDLQAIAHPIPIQGDWKVHPIGLPADVLDKLYWKNAERIVFAPWLGRRRARQAVERAGSVAEAASRQ